MRGGRYAERDICSKSQGRSRAVKTLISHRGTKPAVALVARSRVSGRMESGPFDGRYKPPQALANTPQIVQLLRVICLRYIFEIVDDEGQSRAYVASHMYRKADKLIVLHRGAEVGIDICRICDWCAVDEDEAQRAGTAQTGWLHDC
ncbi:hypothetical protein GOB44_24575 [Sinorhizobium meliloti]|nr:hypothetical protein [Sinorhizobium meliloti]MDW9750444.1 hypothetical protein [Sinorhizobium meliloti]MDW9892428.1 hypothetical protein [Sinorhizobium meliloti]MDX0096829.1 hypothetical protein [Sinorhizobium meliloti]